VGRRVAGRRRRRAGALRVRRGHLHRALVAIAAVVAVWAAIAYLVAPSLWRHYERQHKLEGWSMVTTTAQGAPGDPINLGVEGAQADIDCAMRAAGWRPADPVRLGTSVDIVASVLARRAYPTAPVSPLYFEGRSQDLAYEKAAARSPSRRHHVRFWGALAAGDDGLPLWLGAATYDRSVGFSHRTGQITHHIGADVDEERDLVAADLAEGGHVAATYSISGVGPTLTGRNGGGDRYYTDGEIVVSQLRPGCVAKASPPEKLTPPLATRWKDWAFPWIAAGWRQLDEVIAEICNENTNSPL
jgi:hypothetical protein